MAGETLGLCNLAHRSLAGPHPPRARNVVGWPDLGDVLLSNRLQPSDCGLATSATHVGHFASPLLSRTWYSRQRRVRPGGSSSSSYCLFLPVRANRGITTCDIWYRS